MKQKNIFLKSKVRSKITFAASPIGFLLAACGVGGGSESSSDDNSSTTTTSTNTSDNYDLNSNNLSSFFADEIDNFTGEYTGSDEVLSPLVDQSQSESYITGYQDKTALVSLTGKNEIDGLLYEYWNDTTKTEFWNGVGGNKIISFSFFDSRLKLLDENTYTNSPAIAQIYNNGFYEFTDSQKEAIRLALGEFEKVTNIKFVEVVEQNDQVGTIRFGMSDHGLGDAYAFATPAGDYWSSAGDVWFSNDFNGLDMGKGTYEFKTLVHELGHAMGLAHPHEGGAQTLQSELDYRNYTVMSYEDPSWAYFGSGSSQYFTISESLMVYDIQALQHMYGANIIIM